MIHVIATIELNDGTRDEFLKHFRELAPQVRAETGCIEYGAAIDLETSLPAQAPPDTSAVTVIEKWESIEALERHLTAPHMLSYRQTVKDFVRGVQLRVLKPVE